MAAETNLPRTSIRVEFSIADLNSSSGADDLDDSTLFDDQTPDDDITDRQSGGAQSKVAKSEGVSITNDATEEDFDDDQPASFPSRVNVTVEKVCFFNFWSKSANTNSETGQRGSPSIRSCCPGWDDCH